MGMYMVEIHITFPCIKMYYRPHNIYKINHGCCKLEKVTSTHNSNFQLDLASVCLFDLQLSVYCISGMFFRATLIQTAVNWRVPSSFFLLPLPPSPILSKVFLLFWTMHPARCQQPPQGGMGRFAKKEHRPLCPAVRITLLTSLLFVHLSLPSPSSFVLCLSSFLSFCQFSRFAPDHCSELRWNSSENRTQLSVLWMWTARFIQCDAFDGALIAFFFLCCPEPPEDKCSSVLFESPVYAHVLEATICGSIRYFFFNQYIYEFINFKDGTSVMNFTINVKLQLH